VPLCMYSRVLNSTEEGSKR